MTASKQRQSNIQILNTMVYNMSALSEWHANADGDGGSRPVVLAPVEQYQTRLLTREDQLLLAVNNISFQEVKDTQSQVTSWERGAGAVMEGWRGISFRAMFSLNDGDKSAMRSILETSRLVSNYSLEIPFVLGDVDENGDVTPPADLDDGKLDTLTLSMPHGSGTNMTLRFAYRDMAPDFGSYPSVVIEVSVYAPGAPSDGSRPYTPTMRWDYSVILNSPNGRTPSDSASRCRYDAAKLLVRSALSALGVTPVAVGR